MDEGSTTQLNAAATMNFRGLGSNWEAFDNKRYEATGGFSHLRADVSHTEDLAHGLQAYAKVQGQASNDALISSEEFSAGGLDTVRGYLESTAMGDSGVVGRAELRSPSLTEYLGDDVLDEWRFHVFADGGRLWVNEALPEEEKRFDLWSYGLGTRIQLLDYLNGSLDVGFPMIGLDDTRRGDPQVHFRLWGEF